MEPVTSSDQDANSQQAMTQEEINVITLLAKGLTNLEIAARLGIDPIQTSLVKTNLLKRFGAKNEAELISMVNIEELPEPPQETHQPDLEINKSRVNILMQVGVGFALFGCFGAYLLFSNLGRMFEGGDRMVVAGAAILLVSLIASIVWRKKWNEATKHSVDEVVQTKKEVTTLTPEEAERKKIEQYGIEVVVCPSCNTINSLSLLKCTKCSASLTKEKPIHNPYL